MQGLQAAAAETGPGCGCGCEQGTCRDSADHTSGLPQGTCRDRSRLQLKLADCRPYLAGIACSCHTSLFSALAGTPLRQGKPRLPLAGIADTSDHTGPVAQPVSATATTSWTAGLQLQPALQALGYTSHKQGPAAAALGTLSASLSRQGLNLASSGCRLALRLPLAGIAACLAGLARCSRQATTSDH